MAGVEPYVDGGIAQYNQEPTMSLKTELDAFRSDFMAQARSEIPDVMVRADVNWPLPASRKEP